MPFTILVHRGSNQGIFIFGEITQSHAAEFIGIRDSPLNQLHADDNYPSSPLAVFLTQMLPQHSALCPNELAIVRLAFLFRERKQTFTALALGLRVYHVGNAQSRRTWTFGITEHVELRNGKRSNEFVGFFEKFVRFTTRTHNHIDPNKGIGHNATNEFHLRTEKRSIVVTLHQFQHPHRYRFAAECGSEA